MIDDGRTAPEGSVIRAHPCVAGGGLADIAVDGRPLSRTEPHGAYLLHLERRA